MRETRRKGQIGDGAKEEEEQEGKEEMRGKCRWQKRWRREKEK